MSRSYLKNNGNHRSFPRVSGDEPLGDITKINWDEFSPRERG